MRSASPRWAWRCEPEDAHRFGDGCEARADVLADRRKKRGAEPVALAGHARARGTIDIDRAVSDGYQRETIFTYDLPLPASFVPANQDGEVHVSMLHSGDRRRLALPKLGALRAVAFAPDGATLALCSIGGPGFLDSGKSSQCP